MNLPDGIVKKYIERGITAIERIATSLETIEDMLHDDPPIQNPLPADILTAALTEPVTHKPFASNGMTYMYQHPTAGFHIVARKDAAKIGGYDIRVEGAPD
jgi:hypothetical protein